MKALKNGTDIRGTAIGEAKNLTAARAELFGKAFVALLEERGA